MSGRDDLARIEEALREAADAIQPYTPGAVAFETKAVRGDPVTAADLAADRVLRALLPRDGEGWLSEETADDPARLGCARVWIVDPLDGTREFVEGIPEWCISVGLVDRGEPVAGGILNPATGELILGSAETGVTYNGAPARASGRTALEGARILASRSEVKRGEWEGFRAGPVEVVPCGSVAYKMGLVAAGRADGTWTLVPKSEWDVAAGVALVRAAGGRVTLADGTDPVFNKAEPVFPNFVATGPRTWERLMADWLRTGRDGRNGRDDGNGR